MNCLIYEQKMQEETEKAVAGILKEDPDLNQNKDSEVEIQWRKRWLEEDAKKTDLPVPKDLEWKKKGEGWLKPIDNRFPMFKVSPQMIQKPSGTQASASKAAHKPEVTKKPKGPRNTRKVAPKRHYLSESSSEDECVNEK